MCERRMRVCLRLGSLSLGWFNVGRKRTGCRFAMSQLEEGPAFPFCPVGLPLKIHPNWTLVHIIQVFAQLSGCLYLGPLLLSFTGKPKKETTTNL